MAFEYNIDNRSLVGQVTKNNKKWFVGLYIRLSKEDGDKIESNSVINQRSMLTDYVSENIDFNLVDTFIDDGYTGTNFNRPAFIRMIEQIKSKNINCVVVKDLSRFGRDYIGVGKYLEQLLPFLNCRFISILDNLDSVERPNEISSVFVRFKHIMNDHYSNEISLKIRNVFDAQRREGKLVSAFAPYGYSKNPNDCHKLIIDDEVAGVVRDIFQWRLDGNSAEVISKKLNDLGILSPGLYRKKKGYYKNHNMNCGSLWRPNTVRKILKNMVYIGTLQQKKKTTRNYKDRNPIYLDTNNYITVKNTHDPIIDNWIFNKIQEMNKYRTRRVIGSNFVYLFTGFYWY